ncbi:MAG: haloacid dehalogenase [Armatimonadetes bacterium]|nr:haloacid dehalogenase [Armatimonadota bacterium]
MASLAEQLAAIADTARAALDATDAAREEAYRLQREVTRAAASAIRAVHRRELPQAELLLADCRRLCDSMNSASRAAPAVYWTGFVLDAQKEHAEAALLLAVIAGRDVPTPADLDIEPAPWLSGLAEAGGELRRYVLDELRHGAFDRAQALVDTLGEVYDLLVGFDYPDAITYGLKRRLDMVRGVFERTLSDVTTTVRESELKAALDRRDGR